MICCVTGHRPSRFPFPRTEENSDFIRYLSELNKTIEQLINYGFDHFISGMADGADLDFAHCILGFQQRGHKITLEGALPYPIKDIEYQTADIRKKLIGRCDSVTVVSDHYFRGCMHKRNRYMVDKAELVLAIWNRESKGGTWSTIEYATARKKEIRYIYLK